MRLILSIKFKLFELALPDAGHEFLNCDRNRLEGAFYIAGWHSSAALVKCPKQLHRCFTMVSPSEVQEISAISGLKGSVPSRAARTTRHNGQVPQGPKMVWVPPIFRRIFTNRFGNRVRDHEGCIAYETEQKCPVVHSHIAR